MAATSSLTAAAASPPVLLKSTPSSFASPAAPFLRPISRCSRFQSVKTKATENDQTEKKPPKVNSILCKDCEGNGAILCTQCKGTGVNSVDHFNGRFKAGALCWLCRGKREILCGSCNGAGFLGGFLSTFDETAQ
uniref:BSD2 cysteine rich domain-containing protein n=1 Tax=Leersia perrieri TaxID=77586 RepID=A0A0D9WQL7_9ORYZ